MPKRAPLRQKKEPSRPPPVDIDARGFKLAGTQCRWSPPKKRGMSHAKVMDEIFYSKYKPPKVRFVSCSMKDSTKLMKTLDIRASHFLCVSTSARIVVE
eukprot:1177064-Prorocentrum_minimum.AAC.2